MKPRLTKFLAWGIDPSTMEMLPEGETAVKAEFRCDRETLHKLVAYMLELGFEGIKLRPLAAPSADGSEGAESHPASKPLP